MESSLQDIREAAELRAALRKFLRASERVAREEGLTPSRFLLLLMIQSSETGRSTVTELAEKMQLTQSTVTELVTRAESAGLVSRQQSEDDARVFWLELTDEGRSRLARSVARNGSERTRLIQLLHNGTQQA
jgi:DNA-binding MarR family transcriptional regulator